MPITPFTASEICAPAPPLPVEERLLLPYPTTALETVRRAALSMVSTDTHLTHRARAVLLTAYKNDFGAVFDDLIAVSADIRAENVCKRTRVFDMDAIVAQMQPTLAQARADLRALGCSVQYMAVIEARATSASPQHRVAAACAVALLTAVWLLEAGSTNTTTDNRFTAVPVTPVVPAPVTPVLDQSLGTELSLAAPLTPAELRLRTPFLTPGLETLRRGILQLITGSFILDQRIRSALLYAYQNDFLAIFADILPVDAAILRETVPKRRKLFTMHAGLDTVLDLAAAQARVELMQGGLARAYTDLLEIRYLSASPQHRLTAACAHLFFGAMIYPEIPTVADIRLLATEALDFILTEADEYMEA